VTVALALTDTSGFRLSPLAGGPQGTEKQTTTWDKVIVDRTDDLMGWVALMRMWTLERKFKRAFLFANNQGFAPATVELFLKL
jgi:hypothetical protein